MAAALSVRQLMPLGRCFGVPDTCDGKACVEKAKVGKGCDCAGTHRSTQAHAAPVRAAECAVFDRTVCIYMHSRYIQEERVVAAVWTTAAYAMPTPRMTANRTAARRFASRLMHLCTYAKRHAPCAKPKVSPPWLARGCCFFPPTFPLLRYTCALMGWATAKDKCGKCGGLNKVSSLSFRPCLPV
jgi:hypothetical protein